jgi:hypothetical protein
MNLTANAQACLAAAVAALGAEAAGPGVGRAAVAAAHSDCGFWREAVAPLLDAAEQRGTLAELLAVCHHSLES